MNNSRLTLALLRPDAFNADIHRVATDAMQQGYGAVMFPPVWTARLATMLRGTGVRLCSTVCFPHGTSKSTVKAIEATSTIKDGADEIAIVPHLVALLRADFNAARFELLEIVRAARAARRDVTIKVVIELPLILQLPDDRRAPAIETACRAIRESACDGILTSTLSNSAGNPTPEAISLVKSHAQDLFLEAAVDHPDAALMNSLFAAGADRITTPHIISTGGRAL